MIFISSDTHQSVSDTGPTPPMVRRLPLSVVAADRDLPAYLRPHLFFVLVCSWSVFREETSATQQRAVNSCFVASVTVLSGFHTTLRSTNKSGGPVGHSKISFGWLRTALKGGARAVVAFTDMSSQVVVGQSAPSAASSPPWIDSQWARYLCKAVRIRMTKRQKKEQRMLLAREKWKQKRKDAKARKRLAAAAKAAAAGAEDGSLKRKAEVSTHT